MLTQAKFGRAAFCASLLFMATVASADNAGDEIEFLLNAVGQSDCLFIRNDAAHSASEAESHLRMKYRKGRRSIDSSEDFIQKVASASSWTRKPYRIRCPDAPEQAATTWLRGLLRAHRQQE